MPGVGWWANGTARRRQAMLLAVMTGLSPMVSACGSSVPASPVITQAPPSASRSKDVDQTLTIGPAATRPMVDRPGDGSTLVGMGMSDTVGGLIASGQTVTPFDVDNPVISRLDPSLRNAIQDAARRAQADGVIVNITSGWRSKGFQQRLFDDAVRTFGNVDAAAKYVASPDVSKHVVGEAVDVGPVGADEWLARNGAQFGLCQIYANEIWHFELVADDEGKCPALKENAAG